MKFGSKVDSRIWILGSPMRVNPSELLLSSSKPRATLESGKQEVALMKKPFVRTSLFLLFLEEELCTSLQKETL